MFAFMRSIRLQVERTTIVLWVSCTHSTSARRIRRKKWRSDFASFRSDPLVRSGLYFTFVTPARGRRRCTVAYQSARRHGGFAGTVPYLIIYDQSIRVFDGPHVLASGVNRQAGAVYLLVQRCGNPALIQDSQERDPSQANLHPRFKHVRYHTKKRTQFTTTIVQKIV